ncbi:hypothetical protein N7520_007107 [Penicillium odoratum]|uniref:uncharacterized protein n=1 Tax=Penicillium odoratum TaxID=1167516 RepID=UPI00254882F2|nr:uncharacterized protein N7520_007107 [Penicillium odoratum]KAJ5759951.1 hypothetical protein N7520_007107 [Penicillium odoratum]
MKPATKLMGQPIGACDVTGFVRKGGFGETKPEIKTPLSTMKATSPSPCSGKEPFTWTTTRLECIGPPREKRATRSPKLALSATQIRGFLWPWTGSSRFQPWLFVKHLSPSLLEASFIRGKFPPMAEEPLALRSDSNARAYVVTLSGRSGCYQHNAAHLAQQSLQVSRPGLAPLSLKQDPVSPSQTTASLSSNYLPGILHSHDSYGPPVQEAPFYTYTAATAPAQYSSSGCIPRVPERLTWGWLTPEYYGLPADL